MVAQAVHVGQVKQEWVECQFAKGAGSKISKSLPHVYGTKSAIVAASILFCF